MDSTVPIEIIEVIRRSTQGVTKPFILFAVVITARFILLKVKEQGGTV